MQDRHRDRALNAPEQAQTTARYVLPFVDAEAPVQAGQSVLEIGCGEGGNLAPFLDRGCIVTGVDLNPARITVAETFFAAHPRRAHLTLFAADAHALPAPATPVDLVMIRDALEHIPDPGRLLDGLRPHLTPGGRVFVGFPPWHHPFGGHQHHLASRVLSRLPYWHVLPRPVVATALRAFGESPDLARAHLALRDTRLTIESFEALTRDHGWHIARRALFLVSPHFEVKFGLAPRAQWPIVRDLPWVRNAVTTTAWYVLRPHAT